MVPKGPRYAKVTERSKVDKGYLKSKESKGYIKVQYRKRVPKDTW